MESLARLGIDLWSLLLYAVNFGLVVLLVAKFLTKPILKVLDERKHQIKKNVEEAEELRAEMAKQREKMEHEKQKMQAQLADELSKSRKAIDEKRKAAEADIDAKKSKMLEEVKTIIDEEKANIIGSAEKEVLKLMQKIVLHVVSNEVPEDVVKKSVDGAWNRYTK